MVVFVPWVYLAGEYHLQILLKYASTRSNVTVVQYLNWLSKDIRRFQEPLGKYGR